MVGGAISRLSAFSMCATACAALVGAGVPLLAIQSDAPVFKSVNLSVSKPGAAIGPGALIMLGGGNMTGGRAVFRSATLLQLIESAYGLDREERVLGGPSWIGADHLDLRATADPSSSDQQMQSMLQALLAERFALKVHTDTRPFPGYALLAGKGKPRIKASEGGDPGCQQSIAPMPGAAPPDVASGPVSINNLTLTFSCKNETMEKFAGLFQNLLRNSPQGGPLVMDSTGLTGGYDFDLSFEGSVFFSQQRDPGALVKSVEGQTGLTLEARQVPLSVVIVDSANEHIATPADAAPPLPPPPAEFEVASIKPTDPNSMTARGARGNVVMIGPGFLPRVTPGGEVQWNGASLQQMILFAYDMTPDRIPGAPNWLNQDHWTIVAKTSPGLIPDDLTGMMQKLLENRFNLSAHSDTQPVEAYAMTRSDRKVTLKASGPDERSECKRSAENGAQTLICTATTMAQLADQLPGTAPAYFLQHHAVDQTGITGTYDFTLRWAPAGALTARGGGDAGDAADPPQLATADTIFQAVEKQLGVKVALAKASMSVLVIDHIERTPTEN